MAAQNIFIGIDSGTQGTKAIALDQESGKVLAESYATHELIENNEGRREQEPSWWIDAVNASLSGVLRADGVDAKNVRAIGVSGQQHGMVPLDANGKVIRASKLWCDTETAPQCETITERLGGADKVVSLIGNSVAAGFTASKILWLKEHEPENYERLATVLLPHDYINFYFTGERKTECGDASGTAYFDVAKRIWCQDVLNAMDSSGKLSSCLPDLIESHEPNGVVRAEIADKFGLNKDVLVSSGGGDNMMAAIGTGNVAPGVVTASLGTSGTIYAHAASPVIDPKGELAAFCSSTGAWLPLVCTMNVTVSTELTRNVFGLDTKGLNQKAAAAPVGAEGVLLLPYFNGERTPALPRATASFHGLTPGNYTAENLCRASMEGATLGLRYGLDVLRRLGVEAQEIRLVGGGAKSALWRSIVADVFDCPVVCPTATESGALGAALQAMWCYAHHQGEDRNLKELTDKFVHLNHEQTATPDAENVKKYAQIYKRYMTLNNALAQL